MAMILAAAMVVSMSACGGSKDAGSSGDSSSFTPITLKMGNQHSSDSVVNRL